MPIDYKKYPSNWKSDIRPRIMERANNKCEICGVEHKQTVYAIKLPIKIDGVVKKKSLWFRNEQDAEREQIFNDVKPVKVILTIAHLDHDESNSEVKDERLMAMCQICHLRYDTEEKKARIKSK